MENFIITMERSVFPLTKFFLSVGGETLVLRPGEIQKIECKKGGQQEIVVSSYWIKKRILLDLKENSTIKIKHVIPDAYYLIGASVMIILSILTFLSIINGAVFSVVFFLYTLPLIFYSVFKTNKYFQISMD